MTLLTSLKNWWKNKKNPSEKETSLVHKRLEKVLEPPFYSLEDFEVGDLVTTKGGVCPSGRTKVPVEEVGTMMLWGDMRPAIRVMRVPYLPEELILVKKRTKVQGSINGLWQ